QDTSAPLSDFPPATHPAAAVRPVPLPAPGRPALPSSPAAPGSVPPAPPPPASAYRRLPLLPAPAAGIPFSAPPVPHTWEALPAERQPSGPALPAGAFSSLLPPPSAQSEPASHKQISWISQPPEGGSPLFSALPPGPKGHGPAPVPDPASRFPPP